MPIMSWNSSPLLRQTNALRIGNGDARLLAHSTFADMVHATFVGGFGKEARATGPRKTRRKNTSAAIG